MALFIEDVVARIHVAVGVGDPVSAVHNNLAGGGTDVVEVAIHIDQTGLAQFAVNVVVQAAIFVIEAILQNFLKHSGIDHILGDGAGGNIPALEDKHTLVGGSLGGLCAVIGCGSTVGDLVGLQHGAVGIHPGNGVTDSLRGVNSGVGCVAVCSHNSGRPASEGVGVLLGGGLGGCFAGVGRQLTVFNGLLCQDGAVLVDPGDGVGVDLEGSIHLQAIHGHGNGECDLVALGIHPANEGVAFLGRLGGSIHLLTVVGGDGLGAGFGGEGDSVGVDSPLCVQDDHHVTCGNSLGQCAIPAGEGVAFLGGLSGSVDLVAVVHDLLGGHAVNGHGNGVAVNTPVGGQLHRQIGGRHGLGDLVTGEALEGVAFLGRLGGSRDFVAVEVGHEGLLAVDDPGQGVSVGGVDCGNGGIGGNVLAVDVPGTGEAGLSGHIGVGRIAAMLHSLGGDDLTVSNIGNGIGIDFECGIHFQTIHGHGDGECNLVALAVEPADEGVAFLGGLGGSIHGCAVVGGDGFGAGFGVEGNGVLVDSPVGIQFNSHVACTHGCGDLAVPAGEGVAFLGGIGGSLDSSAVGIGLGGFHTVDDPGNGILVDSPVGGQGDGDVTCAHGLRDLIAGPAGEGVTGLLGISGCCDLSAVLVSLGGGLAVDDPGDGVGVDIPVGGQLHSHVLSAHGLGDLIAGPASEGITDLSRICRLDDLSAVRIGNGGGFAIDDPGNGVGVDAPVGGQLHSHILSTHDGGDLIAGPAGEGVAGLLRISRLNNGCAVLVGLGALLAVDDPGDGVLVDAPVGGQLHGHILSAHGGGDLIAGPAGEGVANLGGIRGSGDDCAVGVILGGTQAVNDPGNGVGVDAPVGGQLHSHILSAHGGGDFAGPAGEGVAGLLRISRLNNGCAVLVGLGALLAVDDPGDGVLVDAPVGGQLHGHILSAHGGGDLIAGPAGEGVAGLGRISGGSDRSAVLVSLGSGLTVDDPGDGVLVHSPAGIDGDVLGGHGGGNGPAVEGVTDLGRRGGSGDCLAVVDVGLGEFLALYSPGHGVLVHGPAGIDGDVLGGHGGRNGPAVEGVTDLGRRGGSGDCLTVGDGDDLVLLPCHSKGNSIGVDSQLGIHAQVLSGHGLRHGPAGEAVALGNLIVGSDDGFTIVEGGLIVLFAVDIPGNGVAVDAPVGGQLHGHILSAHDGGDLVAGPAGEGVTGHLGIGRSGDSCAVGVILGGGHAVDDPGNGVGVDAPVGGQGHGDILSAHDGGDLIAGPAGESVTGLGRIRGLGDGSAVGIGLGALLAVDDPGNGVVVHAQLGIQGDVLSRHGSGYGPAGEAVALGNNIIRSGSCIAVVHSGFVILLAVHSPGDGVLVDSPLSGGGHILGGHGCGNLHIPAGEGVAFLGGCGGGIHGLTVVIPAFLALTVDHDTELILVTAEINLQHNILAIGQRTGKHAVFAIQAEALGCNRVLGNGGIGHGLLRLGADQLILAVDIHFVGLNGVLGLIRAPVGGQGDGDVACAHGGGDRIAGVTLEGVAVLLGISGLDNGCAVLVSLGGGHAVDDPGHGVAVDGVSAVVGGVAGNLVDSIGSHLLAALLGGVPGKGVSFLGVPSGQNQRRIVGLGGGGGYALHIPGHGILVGRPQQGDGAVPVNIRHEVFFTLRTFRACEGITVSLHMISDCEQITDPINSLVFLFRNQDVMCVHGHIPAEVTAVEVDGNLNIAPCVDLDIAGNQLTGNGEGVGGTVKLDLALERIVIGSIDAHMTEVQRINFFGEYILQPDHQILAMDCHIFLSQFGIPPGFNIVTIDGVHSLDGAIGGDILAIVIPVRRGLIVAGLGRDLGSGGIGAVLHGDGVHSHIIRNIGNGVLVDGVHSLDGAISGHILTFVIPVRCSLIVAGLGRDFGSGGIGAVLHGDGFHGHAIGHIGNGVLVDGVHSLDGTISGDILTFVIPVRCGLIVAGLGRNLGNVLHISAVLNGLAVDLLAVRQVDDGVLIDGVLCLDVGIGGDILAVMAPGGLGLGEAFLLGDRGNIGNIAAVFNGLGIDQLTVCIVIDGVGIDLPDSLDGDITVGHGGRDLHIPAHEGVAFLLGIGRSGHVSTVILGNGLHSRAAIGIKGDGVPVDLPDGLQLQITGHGNGCAVGVIHNAIVIDIPANEAVAGHGVGIGGQGCGGIAIGLDVDQHGIHRTGAAVGSIGDRILILRPGCGDSNVICRHMAGHTGPCDEQLAILFRILRHTVIVLQIGIIVHHDLAQCCAVLVLEEDGVLVDGPLGGDGHIICGHGCGDLHIPAIEGVAFLLRIGRCSHGSAVILGNGLDLSTAIGHEGDGVLVDRELSGDSHILCGHGGRDLHIPTGEGVAFLGGIGGSGNRFTVIVDSLILLAVDDGGEGVLVTAVVDLQNRRVIVCHSTGQHALIGIQGEALPCLGSQGDLGIGVRSDGFRHSLAVLAVNTHGVGLNGIGGFVGAPVGGQVDGNVLGRHGVGDLTGPASEGVAILGGCCGSGQGITVNHINGTLILAVDDPGQLEGQNLPLSGEGQILSRHGLGHIRTPTQEFVTFLAGIHGSGHSCAEVIGLDRLLAVHNEGDGILVDSQGCVIGHVLGGHGCGNVIPAGEGVALGGGVRRSNNGSTVSNGLGLVGFAIDSPGQGVFVGLLGEGCGVGCLTGNLGHSGSPAGEDVGVLSGGSLLAVSVGGHIAVSNRSGIVHIAVAVGIPADGVLVNGGGIGGGVGHFAGNGGDLRIPACEGVGILGGCGLGGGDAGVNGSLAVFHHTGLQLGAVLVHEGDLVGIHSCGIGGGVSSVAGNGSHLRSPAGEGVGVLIGCSLGGSLTGVGGDSAEIHIAGLQDSAVLVHKLDGILIQGLGVGCGVGHITGNGGDLLIPTSEGVGVLRIRCLVGGTAEGRSLAVQIALGGLYAVNDPGDGVGVLRSAEVSNVFLILSCFFHSGSPAVEGIGKLIGSCLLGSAIGVRRRIAVLVGLGDGNAVDSPGDGDILDVTAGAHTILISMCFGSNYNCIAALIVLLMGAVAVILVGDLAGVDGGILLPRHGDGLLCGPGLGEGGGVHGHLRLGAGCGSGDLAGDGCADGHIVTVIVGANVGSGAGGVIIAPGVLHSPAVVGCCHDVVGVGVAADGASVGGVAVGQAGGCSHNRLIAVTVGSHLVTGVGIATLGAGVGGVALIFTSGGSHNAAVAVGSDIRSAAAGVITVMIAVTSCIGAFAQNIAAAFVVTDMVAVSIHTVGNSRAAVVAEMAGAGVCITIHAILDLHPHLARIIPGVDVAGSGFTISISVRAVGILEGDVSDEHFNLTHIIISILETLIEIVFLACFIYELDLAGTLGGNDIAAATAVIRIIFFLGNRNMNVAARERGIVDISDQRTVDIHLGIHQAGVGTDHGAAIAGSPYNGAHIHVGMNEAIAQPFIAVVNDQEASLANLNSRALVNGHFHTGQQGHTLTADRSGAGMHIDRDIAVDGQDIVGGIDLAGTQDKGCSRGKTDDHIAQFDVAIHIHLQPVGAGDVIQNHIGSGFRNKQGFRGTDKCAGQADHHAGHNHSAQQLQVCSAPDLRGNLNVLHIILGEGEGFCGNGGGSGGAAAEVRNLEALVKSCAAVDGNAAVTDHVAPGVHGSAAVHGNGAAGGHLDQTHRAGGSAGIVLAAAAGGNGGADFQRTVHGDGSAGGHGQGPVIGGSGPGIIGHLRRITGDRVGVIIGNQQGIAAGDGIVAGGEGAIIQ